MIESRSTSRRFGDADERLRVRRWSLSVDLRRRGGNYHLLAATCRRLSFARETSKAPDASPDRYPFDRPSRLSLPLLLPGPIESLN